MTIDSESPTPSRFWVEPGSNFDAAHWARRWANALPARLDDTLRELIAATPFNGPHSGVHSRIGAPLPAYSNFGPKINSRTLRRHTRVLLLIGLLSASSFGAALLACNPRKLRMPMEWGDATMTPNSKLMLPVRQAAEAFMELFNRKVPHSVIRGTRAEAEQARIEWRDYWLNHSRAEHLYGNLPASIYGGQTRKDALWAWAVGDCPADPGQPQPHDDGTFTLVIPDIVKGPYPALDCTITAEQFTAAAEQARAGIAFSGDMAPLPFELPTPEQEATQTLIPGVDAAPSVVTRGVADTADHNRPYEHPRQPHTGGDTTAMTASYDPAAMDALPMKAPKRRADRKKNTADFKKQLTGNLTSQHNTAVSNFLSGRSTSLFTGLTRDGDMDKLADVMTGMWLAARRLDKFTATRDGKATPMGVYQWRALFQRMLAARYTPQQIEHLLTEFRDQGRDVFPSAPQLIRLATDRQPTADGRLHPRAVAAMLDEGSSWDNVSVSAPQEMTIRQRRLAERQAAAAQAASEQQNDLSHGVLA